MIRQVAKANAILLVQYAVGSLVPLILVPHIVRVIGLEEFGRLAVLMAWGGYGAVVVQYAFQMTGPKRIMQLRENESIESVFFDIVLAKLALLSLVIAVIVVVTSISMPISGKSSLAWLLLYAPPLAASVNSVWFLQSQGQFAWVCLLAIVGTLLTLLLGFNFIKKDYAYSLDYAVLVSVFSAIFTGLGTLFISAISLKRSRYIFSYFGARNAIKEGWHLFISQLISMLYTGSGVIIINYLIDSKAAGAYSATERVIYAFMAAALLTHTAAYPRLAAAYVNSRPDYWRILKLVIFGYLCATSILAILVWLLRADVLKFIYGEINSDHYYLLLFGLLWLVLGIFGTALTGYLTVSGKTREVWPLNLKILASSVLLGLVGIHMFGNYGWLAGLALSQLIILLTGYKHWRKECIQ